jgi:hypothetical protein
MIFIFVKSSVLPLETFRKQSKTSVKNLNYSLTDEENDENKLGIDGLYH